MNFRSDSAKSTPTFLRFAFIWAWTFGCQRVSLSKKENILSSLKFCFYVRADYLISEIQRIWALSFQLLIIDDLHNCHFGISASSNFKLSKRSENRCWHWRYQVPSPYSSCSYRYSMSKIVDKTFEFGLKIVDFKQTQLWFINQAETVWYLQIDNYGLFFRSFIDNLGLTMSMSTEWFC